MRTGDALQFDDTTMLGFTFFESKIRMSELNLDKRCFHLWIRILKRRNEYPISTIASRIFLILKKEYINITVRSK